MCLRAMFLVGFRGVELLAKFLDRPKKKLYTLRLKREVLAHPTATKLGRLLRLEAWALYYLTTR